MSNRINLSNSLKQKDLSGVIERAIENWLINASERSYQAAFCQLLNAMGYSVIHSTSHGPAEEGKDVIAKDSKDKVYVFQLKKGNINVSSWRNMKSEIEELTELPIRHPSVSSRIKHYPVLATNGYVNENVASRIDGMNQRLSSRGFRPLVTWTGSELLMKFIKHTKGFLPQPLTDFHRLLGFFVKRGNEPLDKAEFDLLLKSVLPIENEKKIKNKHTVKRSIASSAIIVEYALTEYDRSENYYAKIEAYTMLFCYIRATAIIHKLAEDYWKPTVEILESAIDSCVRCLFQDMLNNKGFGQGDPLTEAIVLPYRNTLLAGVMAAHGMWHQFGGPSEWLNNSVDKINENILELSNNTRIPSEAFIPSRFLASEYLRQNGKIKGGDEIFLHLLQVSVLRKQGVKNVKPLWNPYLSNEEAILRDLGKKQDAIFPDTWGYETYSALSLILIATNRMLRQNLEAMWHDISFLNFHEFIANNAYHNLLWDNKEGTMSQRFLPQPQKWETLQKEARTTAKLPYYFKKYEHWLPYFFLVYPHRFSASSVLSLCELSVNSR